MRVAEIFCSCELGFVTMPARLGCSNRVTSHARRIYGDKLSIDEGYERRKDRPLVAVVGGCLANYPIQILGGV